MTSRTDAHRGIFGVYKWDKDRNQFKGTAQVRRSQEISFSGKTHEEINQNFRRALDQFFDGERQFLGGRV
jgi:predicted HicB family RNase H-like nuclease